MIFCIRFILRFYKRRKPQSRNQASLKKLPSTRAMTIFRNTLNTYLQILTLVKFLSQFIRLQSFFFSKDFPLNPFLNFIWFSFCCIVLTCSTRKLWIDLWVYLLCLFFSRHLNVGRVSRHTKGNLFYSIIWLYSIDDGDGAKRPAFINKLNLKKSMTKEEI